MKHFGILLICFLAGTTYSQSDSIAISGLLDNCDKKLDASNYESAHHLALTAIKLSNKPADEKLLAESYWYYGFSFEKLGKTDSSIVYYEKALEIAKKLGLKRQEGSCYHSMGWSYYLQGSYDLALQNFLSAVKIREARNDSMALGWTKNNIGLIYWQQHNYNKALDYFLVAREIFENKKDLAGLAIATNNIGLIYEEKGDYDEAMVYYKESYSQNRKADNITGVSLTLSNIGGIFLYKDQLDSAEKYSTEALNINLGIKHLEGLRLNYLNLAEVYKRRKDFPKALEYVNKSISVCLEGKFPDGLIKGYRIMSEIYYDKGDFKEAFEAHQKYSLYNDSLNYGDKITSMEAKFHKEKNERVIALLKKEKEIAGLELKRKQWMIYAAVAGSLLLLGIVVFSIRVNLQRKKTNKALELKNVEITAQKGIIEEKSKDITDSILYAKRIQDAVLPTDEEFHKNFSEHFIIFKPRDIVSGDFYWLAQIEDKTIIVLADCTGHGVPGAFMSIIGHDLLNMLLREEKHTKPSVILSRLDKSVTDVLNKKSSTQTNDGMDMSICVFDKKVGTATFAGACRPMVLIENGEFKLIHGSKYSIGGHKPEFEKVFNEVEIKLRSNQLFYLLSDGFADQFGGPRGKKFKFKQVQEILIANANKSLFEQEKTLQASFNNWKGDLEQVDDVCVIGIKI